VARAKLEVGPVALYAQLAAILRELIVSGSWRDGYEIPTLDDLAREYSLARVTVRQAVQMLVSEGMLSSQRGRRTVVTFSPGANPQPLFTIADFSDISSNDNEIKLLEIDTVEAEKVPPVFAGRIDGRYVRFTKIDSARGMPYSTSVHYIRESLYKRFPRNAVAKVKSARLVRDYSGASIHNCLERISVTSLDATDANNLRSPFSSPAGKVQRLFIDNDGVVIYYAVLVYRGDRFGIERDVTRMIMG